MVGQCGWSMRTLELAKLLPISPRKSRHWQRQNNSQGKRRGNAAAVIRTAAFSAMPHGRHSGYIVVCALSVMTSLGQLASARLRGKTRAVTPGCSVFMEVVETEACACSVTIAGVGPAGSTAGMAKKCRGLRASYDLQSSIWTGIVPSAPHVAGGHH